MSRRYYVSIGVLNYLNYCCTGRVYDSFKGSRLVARILTRLVARLLSRIHVGILDKKIKKVYRYDTPTIPQLLHPIYKTSTFTVQIGAW